MVDLHKEFAPKGLEIVRNPSRAAVGVAVVALALLLLMLMLLLILLILLFLLFLPVLLFLLFLFYRVLKKKSQPNNFIL